MEAYKVTVATGTSEYSGTNNYVYVTLIGEHGESERTVLDKLGPDLCRGAVDEYEVKSSVPLGSIWLVRLEKRRFWVEDNWFCLYVKVKTPDGTSLTFPCYRWFVGDMDIELREGTAKRMLDDTIPELLAHRRRELQERKQTYRWQAWKPGIPKCIDAKSEKDLPQDSRFDNEKTSDFEGSLQYALLELSLKKLVINFGKSWCDLEDFRRIFWRLKSPVAEYVMEHWKEDWFFGYQFLNGSNPRMIECCYHLPDNFPVTGDMVQATLGPKTNLYKEMKLKQTPGQNNPIFLPSDPELAWVLAKTWVRHAEFQIFQLLSHLLRTHLVVEVFCVATLRQLPAVHPVYKLLAPHLRYTLEINIRGRTQLISEDGIFKRVVSTGGTGLLLVAQREYQKLTFKSLLPTFDFKARGVTRLKNYFYREDCMTLWNTIHSFVSGIVTLYYSSDQEVIEDQELQSWINEVVNEGFVDTPNFGLSSDLKDRKELITLLTTVIFTCSVQHAATNNGQIPLGQYPEEYFTEASAKAEIKKFQEELKEIEEFIIERHGNSELKYLYLCPSQIENSITI
ncbi:LOX5 lipoxygenase, partial [Polypterus senegalus]